MITKKSFLFASGLLSALLVFWRFGLGNFKVCELLSLPVNGDCPITIASAQGYLFIFVGVFLFSVIVFFLKDAMFKVWARFAMAWIVLTEIVIFITQDNYSGLIGWTKLSTAFSLTLLFLAVSFILIIWKGYTSRAAIKTQA